MSLKNYIKNLFPTKKALWLVYSCKAPFEPIDTEIQIIGNSEKFTKYMAYRTFDELISLGREAFIDSFDGCTDDNGEIIYNKSYLFIPRQLKAHEEFHREATLNNVSSSQGMPLEEAMASVIQDIVDNDDRTEYAKRIYLYWKWAHLVRDADILDEFEINHYNRDEPKNSKWINFFESVRYNYYYELCMKLTNEKEYPERFLHALNEAKKGLKQGVEYLLSYCPELSDKYSSCPEKLAYNNPLIFSGKGKETEISLYTSDDKLRILDKVFNP